MPVKKLKEFLDANGVKYVSISHSLAYTAQEIAALTHIKGKDLAKTVMVKVDGEMAMAVLPANYQVDLDLLKEAVGAARVELAVHWQEHRRPARLRITVVDASGAKLVDRRMGRLGSIESPLRLPALLPAGRLTLRVEAPDGRAAERQLEIDSLDAAPERVALTLED